MAMDFEKLWYDMNKLQADVDANQKQIDALDAAIGQFLAVELNTQVDEPSSQFLGRHPLRAEIDVEQSARLPGSVAQQPTLAFQTSVERRAGERRLNRDLDVEQLRFHGELQNLIEDLRSVAVEAEDETAVNPDPE